MTIIDEMREYARQIREVSSYDYGPDADQMEEWADRLERSGALVPVPGGGVGTISELEPSVFMFDGKNWLWDSFSGWYSPDDKTAELPYTVDGDLIVHPVRLVPITEAQIDEN